jgi:hypothetical protein
VINVLLIAESPPDPGTGERRFFYAPTLSYDKARFVAGFRRALAAD